MAPAEGACAPLNPAFVAQMEALLGAEAPAFWAALGGMLSPRKSLEMEIS